MNESEQEGQKRKCKNIQDREKKKKRGGHSDLDKYFEN
jgi:hypothetical protein